MSFLVVYAILTALLTTCCAAPSRERPRTQALVSNGSDCTFQYFAQNIDHFDQHNGTFQQKYNLITDFFKPGGPILFFIGEESTELICIVRS